MDCQLPLQQRRLKSECGWGRELLRARCYVQKEELAARTAAPPTAAPRAAEARATAIILTLNGNYDHHYHYY